MTLEEKRRQMSASRTRQCAISGHRSPPKASISSVDAGAARRAADRRHLKYLFLALLICLSIMVAAEPGIAGPPIPPTNLDRPDYDYSNANSCPACHFIDGYDHTARAAGLKWNDTTQQWERTGHGWWDSTHAQSQYGWSSTAINYGWTQPTGPYGETDNTFCAFCHSPLQADGTAHFSQGSVINPVTVSTFMAVTCSSCHPSNTVAADIVKIYPTALSSGETATLIRGDDPGLAASWIPILPGQENQFCLTCHEQDPHNAQANSIFQVMYNAGVTCIDCHMAPYQIFTGTASNPAAPLPERFHDWKVAENLPYSCGAQGSLSGFTCHSEFTADSARAFIPVLTQQHSNWWTFAPFSGSGGSQSPEAAISAHSLSTAADYMNLWRNIQAVEQRGK
jgi:hypothetical protein